MERHSSQTWFRKDIILRHGRPFVRLGLLGLQLQQEIGSHHRHLEEDLFRSCFQLLRWQVRVRTWTYGQAGKLRGKLMFGPSQLWGKVGRASSSSVREAVFQLLFNQGQLSHQQIFEWMEVLAGKWPSDADWLGREKAGWCGGLHRWLISLMAKKGLQTSHGSVGFSSCEGEAQYSSDVKSKRLW